MKTLIQHIEEKLLINNDYKDTDIKDITAIDQSFCDALNDFMDEHESLHSVRFMCYNVNGEPHLFVKKSNKTAMDDKICKGRISWSNYDFECPDFLFELMLMNKKNMLNDAILDNVFMLYAKWSFIDHTSRINNFGRTAHGFYVTLNGMLFNSKKEANKFVKDNKLRTPGNEKALHAYSLRDILDKYKYCQDNYQYDKSIVSGLEK